MNMKKNIYCISIILLLLLSISSVLASGAIIGVISDSLSGKPLVGANVFISNTSLGASTDLNGEYHISGLAPGSYILEITYIGYISQSKMISIAGDETKVLHVSLVADIIEGDVIEVTAQARGQIAAINQQISSNTIMNVVSEEKIQELPDANAAESIGRLSGVSLMRSGGEANKIIVRGLEDKFTVITVDGVKIPPTDATSRGVDLSTLSQSSLAGIELYKAITPDKDGDALAASVNLVTKKAPEDRMIKMSIKGNYNSLMESADQYDLSLRYGERFFNNIFGVQVAGNLERRIRSNERINVDYNQNPTASEQGYFIDDFLLEFTDEIRSRNGFSILLDLNTPDNGTIRFNNVFGKTKRDFFWSTRDYPVWGGGEQEGNPVYHYRDREQAINTFSSSLHGDNNFLSLGLNWGISFAESKSDFPFDYEMIFVEPGGMLVPDARITDGPEQLIPYAVNDYSVSSLYWTYYRDQHNYDKERTAFLDIIKPYQISNSIAGEIKLGGKYKIKDRTNLRTEDFTPYYLGKWQPYEIAPNGSIRPKDFTGTYFEDWFNQGGGGFISINHFFETPKTRDVYNSYLIQPLIDKDRLRQWYELNKNGVDITGNIHEVWPNPLIRYDDYTVTERVGAGYIMNTINMGQKLTVIAGFRLETEVNDYISTYMPKPVSGFPVPAGSIRDTTSSASQTVFLPNLNIAYSPLDFMKMRVAAYKALARPDFNMRLDRYIAGRPAEVGTQHMVAVGNSDLKTAQAWNYEVNTSFFGNTIGLISLSVYYKDIKDMYHMLNRFNAVGDTVLNTFGIGWTSQMGSTPYFLSLPYNSPKSTKVWGFEFEHQINFHFLPGLLKNIVLSYNVSVVRSEAFVWGAKIDSVFYDPPGPSPARWNKFYILAEQKQKLEGMPEFFGNISLGYDIGNFSGRVSLFHQGEYNTAYSASGLSDQITNAYTRIDLALKYKLTKNLSVFFNGNNLTNIEDGSSIYNTVYDRTLFNESEKYGATIDFGVTAEF